MTTKRPADLVIEGKAVAYAPVRLSGDRWGIGIAVQDEEGYRGPLDEYGPYDEKEARRFAEGLNKDLGLDLKETALIIASSMRGAQRSRGRR